MQSNLNIEKNADRKSTSQVNTEVEVKIDHPQILGNKEDDKLIEQLVVFISIILVIIAFPLSLFCIFVVSRQFERIIILRNGKVYKNRAFGPGLICYLPCVDSVKFVDLRTVCYEIPPQEALTKDSLTVSVDAVVFYKVYEPVWAVLNVANYGKDIRLPLQLQKAMAAEAESSRLANAKIIVAKAEIEAMKSLQTATNLLMDNPMSIQLRYLQSLQTIAGDETHTIVFPFSVDSLRKIFNR
ncbi:band 7 protein CG42540-like isoform X2 [Leptidea sinapis]|uniref:band 7 protein CG42540-like isoform X2 n=1 Tax=Leptidea sinapis TaxID=189913 RepID=UPI0021277422|nr:band 7 protein CG42540-like isoform X2 [Leptidea sinapis]